MATLMQIRAALEDGQARGLKQLSRQVDAPPALVEAILERLIALGKVERVAAQSSGGCGGGCKGCAQRDPCANRSRISACARREKHRARHGKRGGLFPGWRDQARVG
ncbi:FeoC-like transcriptional regulator [Pseudomonas aeruginosa]